jgi:hypothetical protein
MHLHCRRSCSLCRLPEGTRQLAYADAQRAQQQRQQPAPGGEQAGEEEGQEGGWASAAAERRGPHVLYARAWRSTDGGTGEGGDGILGDLTRGMLYGGLAAWAFALVALLGAILRSTWVHSKRGGLTGGGAELRGRHAWSRGGGSRRSSPRLPLLRCWQLPHVPSWLVGSDCCPVADAELSVVAHPAAVHTATQAGGGARGLAGHHLMMILRSAGWAPARGGSCCVAQA